MDVGEFTNAAMVKKRLFVFYPVIIPSTASPDLETYEEISFQRDYLVKFLLLHEKLNPVVNMCPFTFHLEKENTVKCILNHVIYPCGLF